MEKGLISLTFKILLTLLCLVFLITMLALFSSELADLPSYQSFVTTNSLPQNSALFTSVTSSIYNSLSLAPISDIYLINANETCSGTDSLTELYNWNFNTFCFCPLSGNIMVGTCNNDKNKKDCFTTNKKALVLSVWKRKLICISRLKNDAFIYKDGDNCKDGFLECGGGVCVRKEGGICPITKVKVVSEIENGLPTITDLLKSRNSTTKRNLEGEIGLDYSRFLQSSTTAKDDLLKLGYTYRGDFADVNKSKLYISRSIDNQPIIDLKIGVNGPPCIYSNEENLRVSSFQFMKASPNDCKNYGSDDALYSLVDREKEWDFLTDNNLLTISTELNILRDKIVDISELYSKTMIKNTCSKGMEASLNKEKDKTDKLIQSRRGSDAIGLIFVIIAFVVFIIHAVYCFLNKFFVESSTLIFWITLLIIIEEIICPISLKYIVSIENQNNFIYEMGASNCFINPGYNKLFSDVSENYIINTKKIRNFVLTILYYGLLMFIINIIYFLDKLRWNVFFKEDEKGLLEKLPFTTIIDEDDWDCEGCLI